MHQKHVGNQNSKPEISVASDIVDILSVAPLETETAEYATLKPKKTTGSENGNNAHAYAAVTAQTQPRHPTRQRKAPQRLGFST